MAAYGGVATTNPLVNETKNKSFLQFSIINVEDTVKMWKKMLWPDQTQTEHFGLKQERPVHCPYQNPNENQCQDDTIDVYRCFPSNLAVERNTGQKYQSLFVKSW
ncbi:hypothetical protein XENORESO_001435 [Xenotaenia resolanae]|uniref:Uncharacterized protein n=1 Tax=Xenotaenia resolanae TaxID=208358 RepID=A0ABV0WHB7_9TELE